MWDQQPKCLSFWVIIFQGFAIGQRGPAFLDLQIITHTDVEAASFFFTATSVGYLVGSLVAGMVYNKVNKSLLMLLTVMGLAVTTVAIPWCSPYALMVAIHFVASLFAGGIDTGWFSVFFLIIWDFLVSETRFVSALIEAGNRNQNAPAQICEITELSVLLEHQYHNCQCHCKVYIHFYILQTVTSVTT